MEFENALSILKKNPGAVMRRDENGNHIVQLKNGEVIKENLTLTYDRKIPAIVIDDDSNIQQLEEKTACLEAQEKDVKIKNDDDLIDNEHHKIAKLEERVLFLKREIREKDVEIYEMKKIIDRKEEEIINLNTKLSYLNSKLALVSNEEWKRIAEESQVRELQEAQEEKERKLRAKGIHLDAKRIQEALRPRGKGN